MSLSVLIIDRHSDPLDGSASCASVLALPLGTGTVLESVICAFGNACDGQFLVASDHAVNPPYADKIRQSCGRAVECITIKDVPAIARQLEQGDALVVMDVGQWPLDSSVPQAVCRRGRQYMGATSVVALGRQGEHILEWVQCTAEDEVTETGRSYGHVVWPELATQAVVAMKVPAPVLRTGHFASLCELRQELSRRGMLIQDIPVSCDYANITEESGLFALQESALYTVVAGRLPVGFHRPLPSVLVGPKCSVHPAARLVGPLILQENCAIAAGATIVGPGVVGAGTTVASGATLAQCVVGRGEHVRGTASLWRQLVPSRASRPGNHGRHREPDASLGGPAFHLSQLAYPPNRRRGRPVGPGPRWCHRALKRFLDLILSAIALIVLSPLLLAAAVLIKLDSPGPVLFTHYRERRGGRSFPCWKFRTMVKDAHQQQRILYQTNEVDGPQFKMRQDPRVTRIGRWLRTTNIDELPQLLNILVGHMSLVGPRPSPFRENQICVPWRKARLSMRPGITGLWQLCRDRESGGDFHQWIFYDLVYVRHFSIWLDLRILVATVLSLGGLHRVPMRWLVRMPDTSDLQSAADKSFGYPIGAVC